MNMHRIITIAIVAMVAGCDGNPAETESIADNDIPPIVIYDASPFSPKIYSTSDSSVEQGGEANVLVILLREDDFDDSDVVTSIIGEKDQVSGLTVSDSTIVVDSQTGRNIHEFKIFADDSAQPFTRKLIVRSSNGAFTEDYSFDFNVVQTTVSIPPAIIEIAPEVEEEPISQLGPDVYLLIGQSNMVGDSEAYARQLYENGADTTNPRILQLNVTANNDENFLTALDYESVSNNVVEPKIVTAQDPLHNPNKTSTQIGLGISFAKAALADTSGSVVLVPAAWSSSAFCDSTGSPGQWNVDEDNAEFLGNNFLYKRAILRTREAIIETGGTLKGILWHQGESDSISLNCANIYSQNMVGLVAALRRNLSNVPFVVGTMSRGDEYAVFDKNKSIVDAVHKNISNYIPESGTVVNDDIVPFNGYPCGVRNDCIHFGSTALRELGRRYYQKIKDITNS